MSASLSDAETAGSPACWNCRSEAVGKTIRYNDWQIYRCRACGFRFAADGPPLNLSEHYDDKYFDRLRQRDEMEKWRIIYSGRLDYLENHATGIRLLEAGAGASTFAIHAVERGFEVTVIDGSEWAVGHLTALDGIAGSVADLNELQLGARSFDAVHCSHLLEHLSNPRSFLSACFEGLEKDGLLYLSFPAYEPSILGVRDFCHRIGLARHPYNYQAPDHLSYFSGKCIRAALSEIGFSIDHFKRTKFVSLHDSFERMNRNGVSRKILFGLSCLLKPLTSRLGFHRDLEIIARRPS